MRSKVTLCTVAPGTLPTVLILIKDAKQVRAATKAFRAQLATAAGKPVRHWVGFPSGSGLVKVWVLRDHRFFFCQFVDGDLENRYWNGFGLVMPEEARILPLVVEVNVPREGVDRLIGGVFLQGPRGEVYVGHRGRIGGGRKGVGKAAFWARYHAQAQPVLDDDSVIVLGKLGSPRLPGDLATFVRTVDEIKRAATSSAAPSDDDGDLGFTPEFEGTKSVEMSGRIEAQCHHGTIVRQLRDALVHLGWRAGNDRVRDLVGRPSPDARPVTFEVKTDTASQSIFTGVGQLVMHTRPIATGNAGVLVVPDDLSGDTEKLLATEGILVQRYRWLDDHRVAFDGLHRLSDRVAHRPGR